MAKTSLHYLAKTFFVSLALASLAACDLIALMTPADDEESHAPARPDPYVFTGTYNLIKVPVPPGGIDFPIGIDDDDTARVERAYYIGETMVTYALYDTVSRWAVEEKEYGKYYGLNHKHNEAKRYPDDYNDERFNQDAPVTSEFAFGWNAFFGSEWEITPLYALPIWCNAFTEWYNEKYGANLVPVYQDSYGNPIRYINNSENFHETAAPDATGFRMPSAEEWELAARWNGNSSINSVTKTINGVNFAEQPVRFTKGNSASGAAAPVDNFRETSRVAVWSINAGFNTAPVKVKTKTPNALGLYDMSGNAAELISAWRYVYKNSLEPHVLYQYCKGGSINSNYDGLAVGGVSGTSSSGGFRVVRYAE